MHTVRDLHARMPVRCGHRTIGEEKATMPTIRIDNREVRVPAGSTILEAARRLGIEIPTLCHMEGFGIFTSCMVCLVEESVSKRLLPSCSAPAVHGMIIETDNDTVREARRDMLELLLREHVGDCESPCMRACPVHLDIPVILRRIREGSERKVYDANGKGGPLISVLAHICPAPCEKACRRRIHDEAVSIRLAIRQAVLHDLELLSTHGPDIPHPSRSKVAIVGAGPAGLSASWYLSQYGHACTVFDNRAEPGGALRYELSEERLPRRILDEEIDRIRDLGVSFSMNREFGRDIDTEGLRRRFDAVIITSGRVGPEAKETFGLEMTEQGLQINRKNFETSLKGVFAGGSAVRSCRIAARAVADGRAIAHSVHRFLDKNGAAVPQEKFDCRMGTLHDGEIEDFLKGVSGSPRIHPSGGEVSGFSIDEAAREAERCLRCDCGGKDSCLLRQYAGEYGATGHRYVTIERVRYRRIVDHPHIVFEPSKCIKCGRCVRLSESEDEPYGLAFNGRSFNLHVAVPFREPLSRGLEKSAVQCARACPTGALTEKRENTKIRNRNAP